MRNALRSLNIALILLGTDAHVSNMVEQARGSSTSERIDITTFRGTFLVVKDESSEPWCFVAHNLPSVIINPLRKLYGSVDDGNKLMPIVRNSRPYFAQFLYQKLAEGLSSLDDILPKFFDVATQKKSMFSKASHTDEDYLGLLGQSMLFMNSCAITDEDEKGRKID